jgi:hypothetical protein
MADQYGGTGAAKLLNANHQYVVFATGAVASGNKSLAVQLERQKSAFYPWGAAFQVLFSADPGTIDIEVQGAEIDADVYYVKLASITSVNASFVGRYDMLTFFPKFVRLHNKTVTNAVSATEWITR